MRTVTVAGLVSILVTSSALGQAQPDNRAGTATSPRAPSTLKNLNARIEQVSFEDAPLDQVMDWLGTITPMNVNVKWQVLEDAGVNRDKPITMNVSNLRLSQVLWLLMQEASGPDLKLAYRASGDLLIISTAEDLGKEMVVRVYDVSDLLVRATNFRNAPQLDITQASQGGGQGGGGSQNIFGGQGGGGGNMQDEDSQRGGAQGQEQDQDIQKLIDLIVQTVEPDSWATNGGQGTIQAFRNLLVVRNNILVHQALGGYVEEGD